MLMVMVAMICFFSGAYSLYLFSIIGHGEYFSTSKNGVGERVLMEHLNLSMHYI